MKIVKNNFYFGKYFNTVSVFGKANLVMYYFQMYRIFKLKYLLKVVLFHILLVGFAIFSRAGVLAGL